MVKDLLFWRFVEAGSRNNILAGAGDYFISSPKVGYVRIEGNSVKVPTDYLVSFNIPIVENNELVLDHHYKKCPVKKCCEEPLQIQKIGVLVRLYFSRFNKEVWTYPYLDVIRILPSVHEIKMMEHFRIRAEVDKRGKLTGKAYMVWGRHRPVGKNTKTFISWQRFFEAYALQ